MSILNKIAYYQNRRDEVPNQKLAAELVKAIDKTGIREIAENLQNDNPSVQADCLKVLYEVGFKSPSLISGHVEDLLRLLGSENNRLFRNSCGRESRVFQALGHEVESTEMKQDGHPKAFPVTKSTRHLLHPLDPRVLCLEHRI